MQYKNTSGALPTIITNLYTTKGLPHLPKFSELRPKNGRDLVTILDPSVTDMGVDHRGTGGQAPPEFGVGDANANCPPPPDFVI